MAVIDSFRRIADKCRAIPNSFGLREYTVKVLNLSYNSDNTGDGDMFEEEFEITVGNGAPPKVRFPSQQEIALGFVGNGDVIIGPFTPAYDNGTGGTGGILRALLDGSLVEKGDMLQLWIQGPQYPNGVAHRIKKYQVDKALRIVLVAEQVEPTNDG